MLWLGRPVLLLMPIKAMGFAVGSISSMMAGSFPLCPLLMTYYLANLLNIQIVIRFGSHGRAPTLGQQVATQKWLQISIEDLVHVAHFDLGPVILGDAIGL